MFAFKNVVSVFIVRFADGAKCGAGAFLVEKKLTASGYNPGAADGKVTKETRQAIARYQRASGLTPTGFMDQKTFSRMVN